VVYFKCFFFYEKQIKIGDNKMKKILCTISLCVLFSLPALADGVMGAGNKTCTSNCFANPDVQVQPAKDLPAGKSLTETVNDYFNKITGYFIEIGF
jgi:hypothetical protein